MTTTMKPLYVINPFDSFSVNQLQSFDIILATHIESKDLIVTISNPIIGLIDKQLEWTNSKQTTNKCHVTFRAPTVGLYTINIELLNQHQAPSDCCTQFQAKAYDLSKVFINGSTGKCRLNESYEFGVDASEAGEGQLEIAVNEGEIPNQVQVLDNGKCIVNFVPEEAIPHVVDIKFNGHNVIGCPFVVEIEDQQNLNAAKPASSTTLSAPQQQQKVVENSHQPPLGGEPNLIKEERILIDSVASFTIENIRLDHVNSSDLFVADPENSPVEYKIINDNRLGYIRFEFKPTVVGDFSVDLKPKSELANKLPANIIQKFPFSIKVFDFNKVIVSDVNDGVIGHPVYFFIDASQAGSGNLEIRVSSPTRNVPNYPQSEANANIRVCFTPTEAVDHSIDVKFNGISVPNNPFIVKVSPHPQARLPITSQDLLKYVAVDEYITFYIDYLGANVDRLTDKSCMVFVLKPDFSYTRLNSVELIRSPDKRDSKKPQAHFKIGFRPTKIGPYKLFISVNNEILPSSPILSNVYNINEVKVIFEQQTSAESQKPMGKLGEPFTFSVDASRAGEGTLALAVVSSLSRSPVQTDVKVSEKGHGLYHLTFEPTELAPHSIDMSFNDRIVPDSPFVVEILGKDGESYTSGKQNGGNQLKGSQSVNHSDKNHSEQKKDLVQNFEAMNLKQTTSSASKTTGANKSKPAALPKEDELLQSIVVHGISLKTTPVGSRGAFIIETNRIAQARDFDVLIADPNNSLVDVQCYLQEDGNLLAEWTPERVGTHKIEVLYKNRPVPNSPFITEAFDPSSVVIENLKSSTTFFLEDLIRFRINCREAGRANLEAILTDPKNEDHTIKAHQCEDNPDKDILEFKPKLTGKYKLSVTFGGYEVPKSPVIISVRDNRDPIKVSGSGLICAEKNRTAQFNVESSSDGELKLRIECGDREIVPKVEKNAKSYTIKYKPTDVGYAIISLYWNGSHIEGSPFSVPVNDLSGFAFISPSEGNKMINNQIALEYTPRTQREIILDASGCGPGDLKAEAYCRANPNIKFSIPVNKVSTDRHKLTFACPPGPEQLANGISIRDFPLEATYLIRFYYNNLSVPETLASVTLSPQSRPTNNEIRSSSNKSLSLENNNNLKTSISESVSSSQGKSSHPDDPVVGLRGHGLVEAKCGEKAEFTIDGQNAGHGKPEVRLVSSDDTIKVKLEQIEDKLFKAIYVAQVPGSYSLNVFWDGKQVAGCPIIVQVTADCDPTKVVCTADSLKGGVLGEEIKTFIDTRKAGPGELTALCTGPQKVAFCELLDRGDGTFILYIKPQESGRHLLTINYGGQHIPKSPFYFKVSGKPDPTKVRVYGPGVEHGVLSLYQSRFVCDTRGAGAGQLTVRIRGPKGAFRMETQRESQRDRTILCKYDPTEPGDYRIEIKWSGRHVPGSPFSVMIFDTQEELNRFLLSQQQQQQQYNNANNSNNNSNNAQNINKMNGASHLQHSQATPFQPTMVEYGGHYSNGATKTTAHHQPKFRLQ